MTNASFFKSLALVSGSTSVLLLALHYGLPLVAHHGGFAVFTLLLFMIISMALYFMGQNAARSTNKVAFNGLVTGSTFGKMVLALGVLFAYQENFKPSNNWFVLIFLVTYVVFTGYEVWFLTKVAKQK